MPPWAHNLLTSYSSMANHTHSRAAAGQTFSLEISKAAGRYSLVSDHVDHRKSREHHSPFADSIGSAIRYLSDSNRLFICNSHRVGIVFVRHTEGNPSQYVLLHPSDRCRLSHPSPLVLSSRYWYTFDIGYTIVTSSLRLFVELPRSCTLRSCGIPSHISL